ncbi:MAG: ABC transporter ATP-binding protein [Acidimicrobiia bacterium]
MKLQVEDLSAGYGSAIVIRDVRFEVPSGSAFAFLGRNGMGKTTLVKAIMGYLDLDAGSIRLDGEEMAGQPTYRLQRSGIGYGPQEAALFSDLSVADNLRIGGLKNKQFQETSKRILASFPVLEERLHQRSGTLSGGEQKMLNLARALVCEPRLLILDEISEGLQPSMVDTVKDVLAEERNRRDMSLLMVEQNVDFALELADQVAVLQVGQVLFQEPAKEPGLRDRVVASFAL